MRSHRRNRIALAASLTVVAVALAAGAGRAAPAGSSWTRLSGPTQAGAQLGLARTADGVLHVIWNRGNTPTSIFETRISAAGRATGTSTVATGFDGNLGLALLIMPNKTLQLFAAGATHPSSTTRGITTFTAPAGGGSWTPQSASWGGAVAESSYVIGAALAKDGQPVTAWRGTAAEGVPPSSIPPTGYQGGMTESLLATDAASGAVVLSGVTNAGKGGVYVQQVLPNAGSRVVLPLPNFENDWNASLSGRIGAAGVYVAYADGRNARLYRYGGGSKTLARGAFASAAVCAGPDGRLWVAWGDKTDGLFVTRSNRAVSAFEPKQRLRLPKSVDGLTFVQCEGSAGPLDLFAAGQPNGGFWHTHLLARLSARAQVAKAKVTISARDAGDAVGGAAITVGSHHLKTDAHGQAVLTLRPGAYSASVTAGGYARASVRFTVK